MSDPLSIDGAPQVVNFPRFSENENAPPKHTRAQQQGVEGSWI
jgi:hypothetical protein